LISDEINGWIQLFPPGYLSGDICLI